jgi:hypothetical protein
MRRRLVATIDELSDEFRHRVRDLVAQFTPTAAAS